MALRHEALGRRIDALRQRREITSRRSFSQVVEEADYPYRLAVSIAGFARALAGTDKPPPEPAPAVIVETPPPPAVQPRPKRIPRPGPHDVLTWDQVLKIPWIDMNTPDESEDEDG